MHKYCNLQPTGGGYFRGRPLCPEVPGGVSFFFLEAKLYNNQLCKYQTISNAQKWVNYQEVKTYQQPS